MIKSKLKESLQDTHEGYGGMILLTITFLSALVMFLGISTAWSSNVLSMADNVAYAAATSVTNRIYNREADTVSSDQKLNYKGPRGDSRVIFLTKEYEKMLRSAKILPDNKSIDEKPISGAYYNWSPKAGKFVIQYPAFTTNLGLKVQPHRQTVNIENIGVD